MFLGILGRLTKVFAVELHNGIALRSIYPRAILWRDGYAIFAVPGRIPIYSDHEGVVQIIDAPASQAPAAKA